MAKFNQVGRRLPTIILYTMSERKLQKQLKTLRESQNITQADAAKTVGMHPSNWARIEDGKICVGLDTFERCAAAINCHVELILND